MGLRSFFSRLFGRKQPKIRVWKLGNLEHRILPTPEAVQALVDILESWDGEGDLDLVWGPDIEVIEMDAGANILNVAFPVIMVVEEQ